MKRKLISILITVVMTLSFILSTALNVFGTTISLSAPKLSLKAYATKAVLSWNRNADADGYEIYWCNGDTSSVPQNNWSYDCWNEKVKLATITNNAVTSYTKTGLSYKKNYHFVVRAYKKSGSTVTYSSWSNEEENIDTVNRLNAATLKSKSSYPVINTQANKNTSYTYTLTAEEITILSNFAKSHFTSKMTAGDKVVYTAEWIRKNMTYGPIPTYSHSKNIFVKKQGQCSDYNGALIEMMAYLGFDVRLIHGYRNGNIQHFWGEVIIDGSVFLMEVGETRWDNGSYKWRFLCNTYSEADGGYYKNGLVAKDSIASYPAEVSGFKVTSKNDTAVNLSWTKVSGAVGYYIYQYDNSQKKWVRISRTTTTANTYNVSGLKAGTEYKFAVKAYRTANGQEISSASFPTLTVTTNPAAVTGFKVSAASANAIKLTWNGVKSAKGYIIYKYDNSKKTWVRLERTTTTANSYLVKNLSSGLEYKFAVKAYRTENNKEVSSPSFPETSGITKLQKVEGIKSSSTDKSIKLSWNAVGRAQGYIVYQYVGGKWTRLDKITGTSYTAKNIPSARTCWFAVKAYRTVNGKEVTSVSFDTYKTTANPAKVDFTVTAGTGRAVVKWNKVAGATGYIVYYKTSANGKWQRLLDTASATSYIKTGLTKGKTYYFTVKAYKNYNGATFNGSFTQKPVTIK